MIYYIYDGSFEGLLTSIYEAYYRKENPEKILFEEDMQENLLVRKVYIKTDKEKAEKVYNAIKTKISNNALENVFYVFLSELEDAGSIIYEYAKLGFKMGKNIDNNIADDRVLKIHKIRYKVGKEQHLMLGIIRFNKLEGDIYYARVEPDNNIVGLVAQHFSKRMADQNWIIHDVKRGIGAVYNKENWIIRDIGLERELYISEDEEAYQDLWKEYFKSIAIKNRINPKLQKRFMPMRYWKYLVEKK